MNLQLSPHPISIGVTTNEGITKSLQSVFLVVIADRGARSPSLQLTDNPIEASNSNKPRELVDVINQVRSKGVIR